MKRLCLIILALVCIGATGEAISPMIPSLPAQSVPIAVAGFPWRTVLMIALPALGIYGRRRNEP